CRHRLPELRANPPPSLRLFVPKCFGRGRPCLWRRARIADHYSAGCRCHPAAQSAHFILDFLCLWITGEKGMAMVDSAASYTAQEVLDSDAVAALLDLACRLLDPLYPGRLESHAGGRFSGRLFCVGPGVCLAEGYCRP